MASIAGTDSVANHHRRATTQGEHETGASGCELGATVDLVCSLAKRGTPNIDGGT